MTEEENLERRLRILEEEEQDLREDLFLVELDIEELEMKLKEVRDKKNEIQEDS